MIFDKYHHPMKIELINGRIKSMLNGVMLPVINSTTYKAIKCREMIDSGRYLSEHEKHKETLEIKLKSLFDGYRMVVKNKWSYDPNAHRTLCCFLRLELDFF